MLASITPLGERGRQMRWGITVAAFLAAATAAGAAAGWVAGLAGGLVLGSRQDPGVQLGAFAAAALLALALDLGPVRVPGPRRQVDERWRARYRGWVYGLGYGAQLGLGVATIVTSAATYLALAAAVLSGSPAAGALVVGVYGAGRGATPLLAARVRRPEQLIALHRRLERWRPWVPRVVAVLLAAITGLALIGALA